MSGERADGVPERFEVIETLVEDELEVAQRCRDRVLGREVVLKRPGPGLAEILGAEGDPERSLREARSLAAVTHPGVQRLLEAVEGPGGPILVLEPVPGETLAERLERDGRLPAAEVARLGAELGDALCAVHAIGAVHRDVAPRHVVLRPDGSACLTGFRLAKFTVQGAETSIAYDAARVPEETRGRRPVDPRRLVPTYPAPEQLFGELANPRTDLFGLGCLLYRALTGEEAIPELIGRGWQPPRDPRRIVSDAPRALGQAILSCLGRSPVGRVQSAAALRDTLRALETEPARRAGRPKLLAGIGAAAALVVAAVLVPGWGDVWGGKRGVPVNTAPHQGVRGGEQRVYASTFNKSYALLIGIGKAYEANGFEALDNAEGDVVALGDRLRELPGDWDVTVLTGPQASEQGIRAAKRDLEKKLLPDDQALIFFAGHGVPHEKAKGGWMIPADGQSEKEDPGLSKWIRFGEFASFFQEASAKHILVLMDCCYGGRVGTTRAGPLLVDYQERFLTMRAHVIIASGRPNEVVEDGRKGGHSPFAEAILAALDAEGPALTSTKLMAEIEGAFVEQRISHTPELSYPGEPGVFVFRLR